MCVYGEGGGQDIHTHAHIPLCVLVYAALQVYSLNRAGMHGILLGHSLSDEVDDKYDPSLGSHGNVGDIVDPVLGGEGRAHSEGSGLSAEATPHTTEQEPGSEEGVGRGAA